jgi:hypothetical protein
MSWLPIETAPKDGTKILLVNDNGEMDVGFYCHTWKEELIFVRPAEDGDVYKTEEVHDGYWETDIAFHPTHWHPLPQPPSPDSLAAASEAAFRREMT